MDGIKRDIEMIFANHEKYFWKDEQKSLPKVRYLCVFKILLLDSL